MSRPFPVQLSYLKIKNLASSGATPDTALVLGLAKDGEKAAPLKAIKGLKECESVFRVLSSQPEVFSGKSGSHLTLFHNSILSGYAHVTALGVGTTQDFTPQEILTWGAKIGQEIRHLKIKSADVFVDSLYNAPSSLSGADAPKDYAGRPLLTEVPSREEFLEKLATGVLLGLYSFDRYKTSKAKKEKLIPNLRFVSTFLDGRKAAGILETAQALADAAYLVRDLQTTPGGDMTPPEIARRAQQAGRDSGVSVTVWDEKKLKSEGMNGILTVGQGSDAPPRFIIMEHNPGKKNLPTIVFVGKGVSFDSGGICIKPAAGMEEMKMDMSGSASVIGAMYALGKMKVPVHAVGLIASAENMINGSAVRPGDIYAAHDGQTIEVINTDAEGRLVLADALSYAKTLKPDCVIDIATLTGAVVIALGHVSSGLMGNNAALIDGFKKVAAKTGERVWELPLYPEYGEDMRSKVADYRNVGHDRGAGSQKGGAFLNFFVNDAYPWIHLDVAGTADTPKGQGAHCPADVGTAVPMRSLVEFAVNFKDYFKPVAKKN